MRSSQNNINNSNANNTRYFTNPTDEDTKRRVRGREITQEEYNSMHMNMYNHLPAHTNNQYSSKNMNTVHFLNKTVPMAPPVTRSTVTASQTQLVPSLSTQKQAYTKPDLTTVLNLPTKISVKNPK